MVFCQKVRPLLSTLLDQLLQVVVQAEAQLLLSIRLVQEVRVLTQLLVQVLLQLSLQQMKKLKVMFREQHPGILPEALQEIHHFHKAQAEVRPRHLTQLHRQLVLHLQPEAPRLLTTPLDRPRQHMEQVETRRTRQVTQHRTTHHTSITLVHTVKVRMLT